MDIQRQRGHFDGSAERRSIACLRYSVTICMAVMGPAKVEVGAFWCHVFKKWKASKNFKYEHNEIRLAFLSSVWIFLVDPEWICWD